MILLIKIFKNQFAKSGSEWVFQQYYKEIPQVSWENIISSRRKMTITRIARSAVDY